MSAGSSNLFTNTLNQK